MADLWDIAHYVEAHPDDHEQRWRLAKKLYMAWEYRLALEHLQVLKNEWPDKINVLRYLAAAYFRLGRYEEAVAELNAALKTWPAEIGMLEQLARVLEVAGRREEAAEAWERIDAKRPNHPLAAAAARRLRKALEGSAEQELRLSDSDSGIDLSPKRICSKCGAQNSEDSRRCWQCGAPLVQVYTPTPDLYERGARETPVASTAWGVIRSLATVALLAAGVYLTIQGLYQARQAVEAPETLDGLLAQELLLTRVVVGLALLALWPFSIQIGLRIVRPSEPSEQPVFAIGVFLAALAYVLSWAPLRLLPAAALFMAVVSLVLLLSSLRVGYLRRLIVWVVQAVIVLLAVAAGLVAFEGVAALREFPAVWRYAASEPASESVGGHELSPATTPARWLLEWQSTGSSWLDRTAGRVLFDIHSPPANSPLFAELKQNTRTLLYKEILPGGYRVSHDQIAPGRPYEFLISGQEGVEVAVVVKSVLRPTLAAP